MSLLRFVSLLALGAWVGGLAVLGGIGAPAIFATQQALDPAHGREAAGRVFGAVFQQFQHLAWALGTLLVVLLILRAVLGPRPRRFAARLATLFVMLGLSLASGLVLAPRVEAIRDASPRDIAALSDGDPAKLEFGRLHGLANGFALFTILAGVSLIWFEAKDEP